MARSPFYDLAGADPERMLVIKVDGATKELLFFGGRVGFVTFGVEGEAAAVLEEKGTGALRSSVSSLPGPSQALVAAALGDPAAEAQRAVIMGEMAARYRVLKGALDDNGLSYLPFNGGVFALVRVSGDPEAIRKRLITEAGVGVVSSPDAGALRVAYCSVSEDGLVELAQRLRQHLG